jgi:hypothetical protein
MAQGIEAGESISKCPITTDLEYRENIPILADELM